VQKSVIEASFKDLLAHSAFCITRKLEMYIFYPRWRCVYRVSWKNHARL